MAEVVGQHYVLSQEQLSRCHACGETLTLADTSGCPPIEPLRCAAPHSPSFVTQVAGESREVGGRPAAGRTSERSRTVAQDRRGPGRPLRYRSKTARVYALMMVCVRWTLSGPLRPRRSASSGDSSGASRHFDVERAGHLHVVPVERRAGRTRRAWWSGSAGSRFRTAAGSSSLQPHRVGVPSDSTWSAAAGRHGQRSRASRRPRVGRPATVGRPDRRRRRLLHPWNGRTGQHGQGRGGQSGCRWGRGG